MIKVGIIGGSGFVAGELMRCLQFHPEVYVEFVYSQSNDQQKINSVHQDLIGYHEMKFSHKINPDADVIFLCLGHGNSAKFLKSNTFNEQTKIIDLSNDFRLNKDALFMAREFVYGLPELHKHEIIRSKNIANPGCFATAIQLAILPLIKYTTGLKDFHIHAITGSTGAGQSLSSTTTHSYRANNISVYKAFTHQHLAEIKERVLKFTDTGQFEINFIPYRGDFTRGIFASIYTESAYCEKELVSLYEEYYRDAPFTHITESELNLKQVVNTNQCIIQVQKIGKKVLINSAIDNLLKGAAGQAIQNMNLMSGFEESLGLNFKASYF